MPPTDTPMNTAHQHAANADEYLLKGLLILSAEEHYKAAEAYAMAIDRSQDESAKRTLRMLHNEHCKAAKELERRIDQLKMEGKDPALPQKPDIPKPAPHRQPSSPYTTPIGINTSSTQPIRPMTDSQNTGDESFMLLGGQRSDPGDAFNQFWNIMQGMLDNLSQPVAFATVPLNGPEIPSTEAPEDSKGSHRSDGNASSDTDHDEPILSKFTRKIGMGRETGSSSSASQKRRSQQPKNAKDGDSDFEDFLEEGDDLSGSFFLIPSGPEVSPAALKRENEKLKTDLSMMRSRLEAAEQVLKLRKEQDMQLRDSIVMATREAQRAMGTSGVLQRPAAPLDFSNLNINVPALPIPGINTGREAQYARRVKELEDELRLMRVENEKNKMMIVKFRERWEKLKDSAKRKKEAKAAAEAAAKGLRQPIVEEPEAEEELDETVAR